VRARSHTHMCIYTVYRGIWNGEGIWSIC